MADPRTIYAQLTSVPDWAPEEMFARIRALSSLERGSVLAKIWRDQGLGWHPASYHVMEAINELECGRKGIPLSVRFTAADAALVLPAYLGGVADLIAMPS